jgi:hypothetical protein
VAGHPRGYRWAPGGQLVQETDFYAPVRGASIALADDGLRANVTASWLAQMGWEVLVVTDALAAAPLERGPWLARQSMIPVVPTLSVKACLDLIGERTVRLIEVGPLSCYLSGHIVCSAWALRADLALRATELLGAHILGVVLISERPEVAALALATLAPEWAKRASVLEGGKTAWREAQLPLEEGASELLSGDDVYHRPYEGAAVDPVKMRAYIDWELGLVAQLRRDRTHNFRVI